MDEGASSRPLPTFAPTESWRWDATLREPEWHALQAALATAIAARRWFGSKARSIRSLTILDAIPLGERARLLLVRLEYDRGEAEIYQLPLAYMPSADHAAAYVRVEAANSAGVLYDALEDAEVCRRLLETFDSAETVSSAGGVLSARRTSAFARLRGDADAELMPRAIRAEQSNSSVVFGSQLILKVFRRVETGINPDVEINEYLTRRRFAHAPPLAAALEYQAAGHEPWLLATLQAFVPNQGDAWQFTLDWLSGALPALADVPAPPLPSGELIASALPPIAAEARTAYGAYLDSVELLGQRTAELHLALAAGTDEPAFAPEPFTGEDRRAYFDRAADEARETFRLLRGRAPRLAGDTSRLAAEVAGLETPIAERYAQWAAQSCDVMKIRCHGDYHLGQVLAAGGDFVIIDFEGEPARSMPERRQKQLALADVAGMVRSLHYAAQTAATAARRADGRGGHERLDAHGQAWYAWSSAAFLGSYLRTAEGAPFLPGDAQACSRLLSACLLRKALYELRYELNNRPDWVYLPLTALVQLVA